MFIENIWYVAAWASELGAQPLARRICDVPVALYRGDEGQAVALQDQCPHRFAPLHLGSVAGGTLQCPYHGLGFAADGRCVANPHGPVPGAVRVRSFPLVERYGLVWLWPGNPDAADESLIPDFSCLVDARLRTTGGHFTVAAHYELITDNLMDLSHVQFLHKDGLGGDAIAKGRHKVEQYGTTLNSNRWCPDAPAPPTWDALFGDYGKPVDHWLEMRWDPPAHMLLDVGVTPAGRPRTEGISTLGLNILTPETATSTHYFWAASRDFGLDDPDLDDSIKAVIDKAFGQEDRPMLEAIQLRMGARHFDEMKPLLLPFDEGAVRARRLVAAIADGTRRAGAPHTQEQMVRLPA